MAGVCNSLGVGAEVAAEVAAAEVAAAEALRWTVLAEGVAKRARHRH